MMSGGAFFTRRDMAMGDPSIIGTTRRVWVKTSDDIDSFAKGSIPRDVPELERRVNDRQVGWYDALAAEGRIEKRFNTTLFTAGDSREPAQAGVVGAMVGSFFTLLVPRVVSFPRACAQP